MVSKFSYKHLVCQFEDFGYTKGSISVIVRLQSCYISFFLMRICHIFSKIKIFFFRTSNLYAIWAIGPNLIYQYALSMNFYCLRIWMMIKHSFCNSLTLTCRPYSINNFTFRMTREASIKTVILSSKIDD